MSAALIALPNVGIREQRALALGIAASIVLHAMVLLMAPGFQAKKYVPELPTLTAVLRTAQPEAPAAAPSPPAPVTPPKPVTEPLKPVAAKPETKPEPPKPRAATTPPAASTPVLTAPSSSAAPSVPAATGTPGEAKVGPAAPSSTPPPASVASAAPSAASAPSEPVDPNALQGYKIQLAAFAQKYQRYPRQALEQKWEGVAEVKITIGENGRIREAVIATSSGHDELDQEAIAMIRKAAPLTEIKSALRNREFSINLPVVFQVKHAGG